METVKGRYSVALKRIIDGMPHPTGVYRRAGSILTFEPTIVLDPPKVLLDDRCLIAKRLPDEEKIRKPPTAVEAEVAAKPHFARKRGRPRKVL
jgi:hypothetical protein